MTKVKIPPEDRIYDVDGYWLRAASVCVKDHTETEVLLKKNTQASHHFPLSFIEHSFKGKKGHMIRF